jgi:AmmeMemoRadiSam system radical SAM enzyme/AmmeMemoRadiSam system protein B/uncharacterized protein (TIGR00296 family)
MRMVDLPPSAPRLPDGAALGGWYHEDEHEAGRLICDLCPRACALREGDKGFCFVRENRAGQMVLTTYGHSTGFCIDPVEKKPLNQFYPNTSILSFGTAGCNLGCKFCQNWSISKSREVESLSESASPAAVAQAARQLGCKSVAFTYNDPVIWAEYAIDCAKACQAVGVKTVAVTAGYITPQARGPFYAVMDAANVDLKGFTEEFYQKLTLSHLQPVLDTLKWLKTETNVWFEITNLIIPQANDAVDELNHMCQWIYDHLGPDVPLHFTAFHPDFRLRDRPATPAHTLFKAYEIAVKHGLHYVYVGNIADVPRQTTYCPGCRKPLIVRAGYDLHQYAIQNGKCGYCRTPIAGRYDNQPGTWGPRRQPVRIADFERATGKQLSPTMQLGPAYTIQHAAPQPATAQVASQSPPVVALQVPAVKPAARLPVLGTTAAPPTQPASKLVTSLPLQKEKIMSTDSNAAPEIKPELQAAILEAAGEILAAKVQDRLAVFADPTLGGGTDLPVFGCFVTAKRGKQLRSCCGFMTPSIPLGIALQNAAERTANDDRRFPPITAEELPHLDIDVWVLFNPKLVEEKGADRSSKIEIGKHGIQIARGGQSGLLLPGVALEHNLNAEQFLQHVCMKAGLPPHTWKEDDVQLATFEGLCIEGHIAPKSVENNASKPVKFTQQDVSALAQWVGGNVFAHLTGNTPAPYAFNVSDGEAAGVMVAINGPTAEVMHITKFALRESVPVQSTLNAMSLQVAQVLASFRPTLEQLQSLRVDIAVFDEVAMHGLVSDTDLRGIDPKTQAVIVTERNNLGIVIDGEFSASDAVAKAAELAGIMVPEGSGVYTARYASTLPKLLLSQSPTPEPGPQVRLPAVAGGFYPVEADKLAAQVEELLEGSKVKAKSYPAVMVPHAGLVYSGKIAGDVFRRVKIPETVIILSPKHTALGVDWAVSPYEKWSLPTGELAGDPALAAELAAAIPGLKLDAAAHHYEHGIEVELPFIAKLAPETKVVGITIGAGNLEKCRTFAQGLASVLKDRLKNTLLVISSDMNHYAADAENRRLDELALECIDAVDAEKLYNTCRDNSISMCGVLPAVIVMETLKELGKLKSSTRVGYATSADVTNDKSRVVGYAGVLFE